LEDTNKIQSQGCITLFKDWRSTDYWRRCWTG